MIEEARLCGRNPALPPNLRDAYDAAWRQLIELGLLELGTAEDRELVSYIIGVIAIGKGQLALGRLSINFNDDERKELLKEAGWI